MVEFDQIMVSPGLCRCCLSEGCSKDLGKEYHWKNGTEVYGDMLFECLDIIVTQHDGGPDGPSRLICDMCIKRLREAYSFKKQIEESEKKFTDMIAKGEFKLHTLLQSDLIRCEEVALEVTVFSQEDSDVEYVEEYLEDFHQDIAIIQENHENRDTRNIKENPKPNVPSKPKSNYELDISPKLKTNYLFSPEECLNIRQNNVKTYSAGDNLTKNRRKNNIKIIEIISQEDSLNIRRRNVTRVLENSTVMPFIYLTIYYQCFCCNEMFQKNIDLKAHYNKHKIEDIKKAMNAFIEDEVNVDISRISCKLCTEKIDDLYFLIDHLVMSHDIVFNKKVGLGMKPYKLNDDNTSPCLVCERKFAGFRHVRKHVEQFHKNFFNMVCEICGATFNSMLKLIKHVNEHRNTQCSFCGERIRHELIVSHILRAHGIKTYRCSFSDCREIFQSNDDKTEHLLNVHHEDNPKVSYVKAYSKCSDSPEIQAINQMADGCPKVQNEVVYNKGVKKMKKRRGAGDKISKKERRLEALQRTRKLIKDILETSTAIPFKFGKAYKCFYCQNIFAFASEFKAHNRSEHTNENVTEVVEKNVTGPLVTIDISELQCKICSENYDSIQSFVTHLPKHEIDINNDDLSKVICFKLTDGVINCLICNEEFAYLGKLQSHINNKHLHMNRYMCDNCGKIFANKNTLVLHINCKHKKNIYQCEMCPKKFFTKGSRMLHVKKMHTVQKCPICYEILGSEYMKNSHLIKVHNVTNIAFKCQTCSKVFSLRSYLLTHIRRVHLKEKNVYCVICRKGFFNKRILNLHMVRHSEERPFQCSICDKTFPRKKALDRHIKIHTNDRPFMCQVCGKSFIQSYSLRMHLLIHGASDLPSLPPSILNKKKKIKVEVVQNE